jgi:hypothetical protein
MTTGKRTAFADDIDEEDELGGGVGCSAFSGGDVHSVSSAAQSVNTIAKEKTSSGGISGRLFEYISFWTVVRIVVFWGLLAGTIYVGLQAMSYASEREVEAMEDAVSLQPPQFLRPLL